MHLCYLDESGTTGTTTGDTTHFVLAGISIPIWHWRDADREVSRVLSRYSLADARKSDLVIDLRSSLVHSHAGVRVEGRSLSV